MTGQRPGANILDRGREALARGAWAEARAAFEDAIRREEAPEALEGLGMAAWWLDDGSMALEVRERAYRLYRRQGDRRGAGRVAITLAEDHFHVRGAIAVARGWHRRAHRLLDDLAPMPEQGWLRVWEADLGLMLGEDPGRTRGLAADAASIGRALGDVDLEMAALALEGLALVVGGELAEGMPRLDEATTAAVSGEMTSPVAIGLSCCYLLHACERVRDFDRAAQWCHRVREFCERTRFNFLLAVCRIQYAGVLAWRGAWAEAEQELLAAVRHFGADRPVLRREGLVRLADLRRQQGRFEEAAALLTEVEVHPLAVLGQAALALDRSEPAAAARLAQRFLRRVPAANRTDRLAALDVLLRARIALGQVREARGVLDELRETDVAVATDPLKAGVLVAEGIVAEAEGARDRAREALEDAIDLLAQSGGSFEVARCRVELARVLAALGHAAEADAALREACLVFEQLGAAAHAAAATALRRDLAAAPRAPDRDPALARLTRREVDVLRLLAQGLSNRAIAARLIVSEFTVKRHVANLLAKLEVPSRAAAAARAARHGLV